MHVLCSLVSHFRLAIESIAINEGSFLAPLQNGPDEDIPYHAEEALTIVDKTMKLIKSISDHGGKEHISHLIKTCPNVTVIKNGIKLIKIYYFKMEL